VKKQIPEAYQKIFTIDAARVLELFQPDQPSAIPKDLSEVGMFRSWLESIREHWYL
jgi:hypothetical protein